ncbi:MAG: DUF5678 domain-containing protein [Endomicrobia bacterium]|nr:DUF5678 domain-containing protein [Endomicrobiia bacterium]MDW8056054.1 DUF5678 domain-containing protein [Elusimicrobiota bacterium]
MEQILIKEKKYYGKYVAIKNFKNPVVVAYGKDPQEVYRKAVKKKYFDPLIVFVPDKNIVQIY